MSAPESEGEATANAPPPTSKLGPSEVRFGEEIVVDLRSQVEPISHETFQSLMDEEPAKPHFACAVVRSACDGGRTYRRLYSAANIVEWYPLGGTTDPVTRGNIEAVEYYLHVKGGGDAIYMGEVYGERDDDDNDMPVWKSADYLIWSLTAQDEPSKMLSLVAVAFLQYLGLSSFNSDDAFDTSNVAHLNPRRSPRKKCIDRTNGEKIMEYVGANLSRLIERGELECSDRDALMTSIGLDAASHLAGVLASQDPNVAEGSDDFARTPHVRKNALAMAVIAHCGFGALGRSSAGIYGAARAAGDRPVQRRRSF